MSEARSLLHTPCSARYSERDRDTQPLFLRPETLFEIHIILLVYYSRTVILSVHLALNLITLYMRRIALRREEAARILLATQYPQPRTPPQESRDSELLRPCRQRSPETVTNLVKTRVVFLDRREICHDAMCACA